MMQALDSIGYDVLHYLLAVAWHSSILLAGIALVCFVLRRHSPAIRHRVWAAGLLASPFLPMLAWGGSSAGVPQLPVELAPAYVHPVVVRPSVSSDPAPAASTAEATATDAVVQADAQAPRLTWWAHGLLGYTAVVVVLLALLAREFRRVRRRLGRGRAVFDARLLDALQAGVERIGLRRAPVVVETEDLSAPCTFGWRRPRIGMPSGLIDKLDRNDLERVLLHELAHVRRGDSLFSTLGSTARAILFFQPLAWFALHEMSRLAEEAADDAVVRHKHDAVQYARLLVRVVEASRLPSVTSQLAVGIGASKCQLLRRVEKLLQPRRARATRWTGAVIAAAASIGAVGVTVTLPLLPQGEPLQGKQDIEALFDKLKSTAGPLPRAGLIRRLAATGAPRNQSKRFVLAIQRDLQSHDLTQRSAAIAAYCRLPESVSGAFLRSVLADESAPASVRLIALRHFAETLPANEFEELGQLLRRPRSADKGATKWIRQALAFYAARSQRPGAARVLHDVSLVDDLGTRRAGTFVGLSTRGLHVITNQAGEREFAVIEFRPAKPDPDGEGVLFPLGTAIRVQSMQLEGDTARIEALGRAFTIPKHAVTPPSRFQRRHAMRRAGETVSVATVDGDVIGGMPLDVTNDGIWILSPPLGCLRIPLDRVHQIRSTISMSAASRVRDLVVDYGNTRVVGFDRLGREVWALEDLYDPVDAEITPRGTFLITEQGDNAIREYDEHGKVLWQYSLVSRPLDADRLTNGNTLITDPGNFRVIEVDPAGKVVWEFGRKEVRDAKFKPYDADRLANGNTLISDYMGQRILEVSRAGKVVWKYGPCKFICDADRLANGNTLVTTRQPARVIEVNPAGKVVWQIDKLELPWDADRLADGTTVVCENHGVRVYDRAGRVVRKLPAEWASEFNRR